MARGPKKTVEEKIEAKQELISSLLTRIESEKKELEELVKEKKRKDFESVSIIITESGLSPEEAAQALQQYLDNKVSSVL